MRYHHYLRQSTYRRYGIFILTIFVSFTTIQAYLNNISIQVNIANVKQEIADTQEKTAFLEKFYDPYLRSEYAAYYLGHESGVLYRGERIIKLTYKEEQIAEKPQSLLEEKSAIYISTPEESWQYFMDDKLDELKTLRPSK